MKVNEHSFLYLGILNEGTEGEPRGIFHPHFLYFHYFIHLQNEGEN